MREPQEGWLIKDHWRLVPRTGVEKMLRHRRVSREKSMEKNRVSKDTKE